MRCSVRFLVSPFPPPRLRRFLGYAASLASPTPRWSAIATRPQDGFLNLLCIFFIRHLGLWLNHVFSPLSCRYRVSLVFFHLQRTHNIRSLYRFPYCRDEGRLQHHTGKALGLPQEEAITLRRLQVVAATIPSLSPTLSCSEDSPCRESRNARATPKTRAD